MKGSNICAAGGRPPLARRRALPTLLGAAALFAGCVAAQTATARTIANNTPAAIQRAQDLGPAAASGSMTVTLWLQAPNADAAAERAVRELYDPSSPQYHHWMSESQASALLAPPAGQVRLVQQYLQAHKLRVVSTDADGLYVRAQGAVADVQNAMHVAIHNFKIQGRTFRSNTSDPVIDEPAGSVVVAVGGLSERHMHSYSVRAVDPDTGHPFAPVPVASGPMGVFFAAQCFRAPEQQSFTTNGGLPRARYFGNRYGADIANQALGTLPPCGYQPSDVQTAYGLNALYASGLDGTGQTIVIVDAIGSPTIAADAEVFSQVYGLPDLTPANFHVYFPGGAPPAADAGWATETSLDVEWAHAIAPNAHIALVIAPTPNDSDLQTAILFAVRHHLGNVISNSYGEAESDEPASLLNEYNQLARYAASRGISVNFSSGDGGDSNPSGITAGLILPGVSAPADAPWATAVGGTSLALDSNGKLAFQTAWGTNITKIAAPTSLGSPPLDPPLNEGFLYGSGGGTSGFFAKPEFQDELRGSGRHVPDIAWLADPYTGVEFICDGASCYDLPGAGPLVSTVGGTSLASPMFSGIWAIAGQAAGGRSDEGLGQAAQILYRLERGAITDILQINSETDVRGVITTAGRPVFESPQSLAQPLGNTRGFYSALYNSPYSTSWFALMFGTDSSLAAGPGWDNATGLGTPNGQAFVDAVVAAAQHSD
ncbi:MAG TPA: S53 family peptidase [Steroidobacteraceae bacterium]|nr:S53 family peptidase [Steroidobacteraceae bacterium]